MQIFRDSTKKQQSLDSKDSSLNRERNDVKCRHASAHKEGIAREATGQRTVPIWAETGLGQPAWADRPSPSQARFGTPFDLAAIQTIYYALAKSYGEILSSSAAEEQRREGHRSREERVEMVD
jgi:hypothetical protein